MSLEPNIVNEPERAQSAEQINDATRTAPESPRAESLRRLYRYLGHSAVGVTEVEYARPGESASVGFFDDAEAFVKALELLTDGVLTVGVQPRQKWFASDLNRMVAMQSHAPAATIVHFTQLLLQIEPATAVGLVVDAKFSKYKPFVAVNGNRALVFLAIPRVDLNDLTREPITRKLQELRAKLTDVDGAATVTMVSLPEAHVEIGDIAVATDIPRVEASTVSAYLVGHTTLSTESLVLSLPVASLQTGAHYRGDISTVDVTDLLASLPFGQIEPIIVRRLPSSTYEIIQGHRRVKACRILGWAVILSPISLRG